MDEPSEQRVSKSLDIRIWGEWLYRGLLLLGVLGIAYLNSRYVTREEFRSDIGPIMRSLADLNTAVKLLQQTSAQMDDHEIRIRDLERQTRDVRGRLTPKGGS